MARRRNSCEDCTTSLSHCCGTCLQYTLHTPHPAHLTTPQPSTAQHSPTHHAPSTAGIPLSMSAMRRCTKCKSSLGLGQRKSELESEEEGEALRHTHANIRTHSLRSCSAWAATFTWRILKHVTAIKAPESAYAHHAHSALAQKQNKTNSASKMIKSQLPRSCSLACTSHSNGTNVLSQPAALFLFLSRCGHTVINIYHISTL